MNRHRHRRHRQRRENRHRRVVRIADRQVVRRLKRDIEANWLLSSDNPDRAAWPTEPRPDGATIIGEVKWLGRALT